MIYIAVGLASVLTLFLTVNRIVYPPLSREYVQAKVQEANGVTLPKPAYTIPKFDRPLGVSEPVTLGAIGSLALFTFCSASKLVPSKANRAV